MNPARAQLIRKAAHIARAHGPIALFRRIVHRTRSDLGSLLRALRHRLTSRLLVRLPRAIAPVSIPSSDEPLVSIIIPVYDGRRYTNACLLALARAWDERIAAEVIVVDDASTDDTQVLLQRCQGVRIVPRLRNGGFAAACNDGARAARGRYLQFLNNDALVTDGWLQALLDFIAGDGVAAAVSQLREADGTLSEAGCIVWSDGQGSNYGRDRSPERARYAYVRDIDYGSAASLMVRADIFARIGGFSHAFASGYYEDTDLCFTLRAQGYRVRYAPRSVVIHLGGMTYGSNIKAGAVSLQKSSRLVFEEKWRTALQAHYPPNPALVERGARRLCGTRCAVIVFERVPFFDRSAGDRRIVHVATMLRERGCHVIFAAVDRYAYQPYAQRLQSAGIELMCGFDAAAVAELRRMDLVLDLVWLSRPNNAEAFIEPFRRLFPKAHIAFDADDLHFVRLQREERLTGRATRWQQMRERELRLALAADRTIANTEEERRVLQAEGIARVTAVPVIEPAVRREPVAWAQRKDIIFVGNYAHAPNEDAAQWLCSQIMPLVWRKLPGARLTLAGAEPTARVRRLANERVDVTGFVEELEAVLDRHRVFAAPIRYGAGVKGKIVQALANGLPVVTTRVGDEGIGLDSVAGIVAEDAAAIADAIVLVHESESLWTRFASGAGSRAAGFTPERVAPAFDEILASAQVLLE